MANNKVINIQPVAIPAAAANILNCAITSLSGPVGMSATQPYLIINHIRVVNPTTAAITCSLWKGGTGAHAAGTEWELNSYTIGSNGSGTNYVDVYTRARLDSADFIVASASATGLTATFAGEIGFS